MSIIGGRFIGGQIVLNSVPDWPEASEVFVNRDPYPQFRMMTEDEQSDDPDEIEKWIAEVEVLPALEMAPEDEARLFTWLKARGKYPTD